MTDSFKNECKKSAYKNRLGKVIVGDETFSNSDLLSSIEIVESCISNNNIIGNTTSSTIKFNTLETNDFSDKEASVQIGVKFDNGTTEYIKNGKYTITNQSNGDTVSNGEYKATDDLYKLDVVYVCGIDNVQQATIGDFYIDVCNQIGLVPKSNTFMNSTIKVGGNPFTNNETCRTVLHSIAQASCSFVRLDWDNNKIELAWFDNTYVDTLQKKDYLTLEKNQVFGPVNSLVIKDTYTEGENVTRQDSQSIQENGECQISIEDNYFLYTEDLRTEAITNIWNRIKGFTYINYKLTTNLGKPYWRKGNKVKIQDMNGDYFDSYIINNTFTYDGTFNNTIEAPSLSTTQTAIKNTQESTSTKLRRVERTVNKVNGEIQDIVDEVDEISETTAELDIKVGELSAEVKTVASPVASDEGTGQREVDDLIANKLMYIKVHPTDRDIVGLYASELLKASTNLKPLSRNITFENTNGKCVYYRIPRDLLYRNGIYDEFVQDNIENKCYVIHRVGLREDGTKYKLPDSEVWEEPIVDYDPIMIEDGSYKVYIDTYNSAYIKVKGLIKNDLTSQLVTEIEFSNKMEMTDKQFSVELKNKVNNKDYTGAKMIAHINEDDFSSEIKIRADKLNLEGYATFSDLKEEGKTVINGANITTGTISCDYLSGGTIKGQKIEGGNITGSNINVNEKFKVDTNGNITAVSGNVGGFSTNSNSFSSNVSGTYNYNKYDLAICRAIILGSTNSSYYTYDANSDGTVNALDLTYINRMINGSYPQNKQANGTFKISATDPKYCVSVFNSSNEPVASLGVGGVNGSAISCQTFIAMKDDDTKYVSINGAEGKLVATDTITSVNGVCQYSLEEKKKNFEKFDNALDIVNSIDIYKYNYKNEDDNDKKHIGLVIGDNYRYSKDVTNKENDAVDLYNTISVCLKAIQEQQAKIEELEERINKYEESN